MLPRLPAVPRSSAPSTAHAATHPAARAAEASARLARPAVLRRAMRQPVARALRRWLSAPGSLTARLRQHGKVTVQVMRQGRQTLWPQERQALRASQGHVREVVLRIDGRPAVWARSSTPLGAVKGPWRAIKGLGTRPLAELLFEHRGVRRGPLVAERLAQQGAARWHLARGWARALGEQETSSGAFHSSGARAVPNSAGACGSGALPLASAQPSATGAGSANVIAQAINQGAGVPAWARRSVFRHRGHPLQVLESFAPWILQLDAGARRR